MLPSIPGKYSGAWQPLVSTHHQAELMPGPLSRCPALPGQVAEWYYQERLPLQAAPGQVVAKTLLGTCFTAARYLHVLGRDYVNGLVLNFFLKNRWRAELVPIEAYKLIMLQSVVSSPWGSPVTQGLQDASSSLLLLSLAWEALEGA